MTKEQIAKMDELEVEMDKAETYEEFTAAYEEYSKLEAIMYDEYRKDNEPMLHDFYEKYIRGKSGRELRDSEEWDYYSDFYKDVYGVRPRLGLDEIA